MERVERGAARGARALDLKLAPEPIDMSVIAGLRELDDDEGALLGELIVLFESDTPARLRAIRQALGDPDGMVLARAAHVLKSSAGNLGAQNMASLCQQLEQMGRAGDLSGARPLVDRLDSEFAAAQAILARHRPS